MFGFQSKLTLALKVAELSGILSQKDAELARNQANLDWLMAHVNELKLERAQLLERCFGIQVPVMEIARQAEAVAPVLPGADANYAASPIAEPPTPPLRKQGQGDLMAIAREIRDKTARGKDASGAVAAALGGVSFEDMGDEAAAEAGIRHDAAGELVHTKG